MSEKVSLVITTIGRSAELKRLLDSIVNQTHPVSEVIVVDQSEGCDLRPILKQERWPFPLRHVATPTERGVSRGRNRGWRRSSGDYVLFPDDDCWYPPHFIQHSISRMKEMTADVVSGRAADAETGRSINGRFEDKAQWVTRENVWTTQIEWTVTFKREVLSRLNGFDPKIGVGAASAWQSCEGQDITLRGIDAGFRFYYDPSVYGYHAELNTESPDFAMRVKGRNYARGHGYVLRRHGFGLHHALYWMLRPAVNMAISALGVRIRRTAYYFWVAVGRIEGYLQIA